MELGNLIYRLGRDSRGAAAAEMALVVPLLLTLVFGAMELGKYFLDQHVLITSVRDGARYAARRSFFDYTGCSSGVVQNDVYELTRTGKLSGGAPRLSYWPDDAATVTVTVDCTSGLGYEGIYRNLDIDDDGVVDDAPVVTVSASVPYQSLLGSIGFSVIDLELNARSQAAVAGA